MVTLTLSLHYQCLVFLSLKHLYMPVEANTWLWLISMHDITLKRICALLEKKKKKYFSISILMKNTI